MPTTQLKNKSRQHKVKTRAVKAGENSKAKKPLPQNTHELKVPWGIRVISDQVESKLELRRKLGLTRELFSRLVNTSVRTIATIESTKDIKSVSKFGRNYAEVNRLCQSLSEVVESTYLGEWFNIPNEVFEGLKPIEVIERGEIDKLWDMVYRLRSGMPG